MTTDWVPFNLSWGDDVPIDISFVFEHEKPAGKHGFLTAQGERLVFQDGTEGRFWGTNFNSGANFPPHAYSEMVARRLAKFGVNIVRTHQMDSEWATPNIFQFNRARPKDHTRTLDPDSLDRLDYLIYCLKAEGIYLYLDLLTYRQFRPGDGVDAVDALPQAAKPYLYFDPRLIALQKEYNEALWSHVNPYTGLALSGRSGDLPERARQRERLLRQSRGVGTLSLAAGSAVPGVGGRERPSRAGSARRLPQANPATGAFPG